MFGDHQFTLYLMQILRKHFLPSDCANHRSEICMSGNPFIDTIVLEFYLLTELWRYHIHNEQELRGSPVHQKHSLLTNKLNSHKWRTDTEISFVGSNQIRRFEPIFCQNKFTI